MYRQTDPLLVVLVVIAFVVALVWLARRARGGSLFTVVYDWEYALSYLNGRFDRILPSGRYLELPFGRRSIFKLRRGEQFLPTPPVDVTSADKLVFRLSATLTYEFADPRHAFESRHVERIQLAVSAALIRIAAARTLESLLSERATLDAELLGLIGSPISGCDIRAAAIGTVVMPPEVRRLFSEVERARLEGAAALERARGEQASLRSLANAARMLKGNPELMNLRLLQSISGQGKGQAALVLGQGALLPIPPQESEPAQHS